MTIRILRNYLCVIYPIVQMTIKIYDTIKNVVFYMSHYNFIQIIHNRQLLQTSTILRKLNLNLKTCFLIIVQFIQNKSLNFL